MDTNPIKRKLSFHNDINLNHDRLWCLDCHNASNRDRLNLTGGDTASFNELERLCGVCHGVIYTEWSHGVHGKRTGKWNGEKYYLICTDCHNPHSPKFMSLKPEPPPLRPERTLR
jgi:formate-dependent nitrite reductase cytochrome c552 subunit